MLYSAPAPKPMPFAEIDFSSIELGDRFIHRIHSYGCYYVQMRVSVKGKIVYGASKTFYDKQYGGWKEAYKEAIKFREAHVYDFFKETNYDPTFSARRSEHARLMSDRPRKFTVRKQAESGLMSNLRFITIRKNKICILEISQFVHGKRYFSNSYSYSFEKYGGKAPAIKAAKNDRDKLVPLFYERVKHLNEQGPLSDEETRKKLKAIKIKQIPPQNRYNMDVFLKRAKDGAYWIAKVAKEVHYSSFRANAVRFYDRDFKNNKNRSKIAARKYIIYSMNSLCDAADMVKAKRIRGKEKIKIILEKAFKKSMENHPAYPSPK